MRKLILVLMLSLMAVCVYSADYVMVMFKCGVKSGNVIEPNISDSLSQMGLSATYAYDGNTAYVFAIVKDDLNITWLAITNLLMPLSQEEETKYADMIMPLKDEVEYLNGTKIRPDIWGIK